MNNSKEVGMSMVKSAVLFGLAFVLMFGSFSASLTSYQTSSQVGYEITNFSQGSSQQIGLFKLAISEASINSTNAEVVVNNQPMNLALNVPVMLRTNQVANGTINGLYIELTGVSYSTAQPTITLLVYSEPLAQATTTVPTTTVSSNGMAPSSNTLTPNLIATTLGTGIAIVIAIAAVVAYSRMRSREK